jgi:hypothetical protein
VTAITLLEKAHGSFSPRTFETMVLSICQALKAEVNVQGKTIRGWIKIYVRGDDESAAINLLNQEIGLAPISIGNVKKFSSIRGKVIASDKSTDRLRIDIGVYEPKVCDAIIPIWRLRAQLADGKNLSLQSLSDLFCLHDFMPLRVKIVADLNVKNDEWEAELSEAQLSQFSAWLMSNLDRLIVLGASHDEAERVVDEARHFRDVIKIENVSPLEQAIVCKLGTDAVGLIPKLGPYLRTAYLAPFSPRKIRQVIRRPF